MPMWSTTNGTVLTCSGNPIYAVEPLNPLGLPPYTIRCRFNGSYTPSGAWDSLVCVDSSRNVWDITKKSSDWGDLLGRTARQNLLEVLGANTKNVTNMYLLFASSKITTLPLFDTSSVTNMGWLCSDAQNLVSLPTFDSSNVTDMQYLVYNCRALTSFPELRTSSVTTMQGMLSYTRLQEIPLLDTSSVTNMVIMLAHNTSLRAIPLFNTSSVVDMNHMCSGCFYVQEGALALYNQASSQAVPPAIHHYAFENCGIYTTSGSSELRQIPSDWK